MTQISNERLAEMLAEVEIEQDNAVADAEADQNPQLAIDAVGEFDLAEMRPLITELQALRALVAETGSESVDDLRDMAIVGHSLMASIEAITKDGPYKDWAPAENPAEIVTDLLNDLEDALRASSGVEVKLAWEHLGGDNWRVPAPFFGSFRVEHYSGDYQALWSAPGITDTFIEGGWPSSEDAKRAIEDKVRAILSCLSSPLTTVEVTEDWQPIATAPHDEAVQVCGGDILYPITASWSGEPEEEWTIDAQGECHDTVGWPEYWRPLTVPAALSQNKGG